MDFLPEQTPTALMEAPEPDWVTGDRIHAERIVRGAVGIGHKLETLTCVRVECGRCSGEGPADCPLCGGSGQVWETEAGKWQEGRDGGEPESTPAAGKDGPAEQIESAVSHRNWIVRQGAARNPSTTDEQLERLSADDNGFVAATAKMTLAERHPETEGQ